MTGRGAGRPATTPWGQESAPRCRPFRRIRRLADRDSKGWAGRPGRRRNRGQVPRKLPSGTAGLAVRCAKFRTRSRDGRWVKLEADGTVAPERNLHQLLLPVASKHDKEDTFAGTVSDRTHRVRRSILNLEQLPDIALYETLSEGMPLIVDNATNLDETARRLYRDEEYRASEVMRGFAEEEAAKVLILIDYVRCPRSSKQRSQVLKRFYGHVAKRIHAMACDNPRIASFKELSDLVESESRPWYLDGPNGIDWIFANSISEKREHDLYVDYVQDVTDPAGACHWTAPAPPVRFLSQYQPSDCVTLVRSLLEAGALSTSGLAEIADVWRSFVPVPDTDRRELRHLILETLERLAQRSRPVEEDTARFIISHWPFPLWPLTIKEPRPDDGDLDSLREERKLTVEWIESTEAERDPPPAISRATVEDISEAYAAWENDIKAQEACSGASEDGRLRFRSSADAARDFELASYSHAKDKLAALSDEERAALVALGWFARERIANWPRIYERAIERTPTLDEVYQIGLGCYWLSGLDRWESTPQPFSAGQWYRADRP